MKKEILKVSILYLFISLFFFLPLFYPEPQIFITPDFGRSDIWNYNYPVKNFLSESLKQGELPLWSKDIGAGFPFLAEGPIGTFHPLNFILFRLFPTWFAFNLSYLFIFTLAALGTFLFLRTLKTGLFSSFVGGFVFAFSGYNIVQINHINLLLASSHLPWTFLCLQNLIRRKTLSSAIFLSFILSLQFFSGFPQLSFVTFLSISLYLIYNLKRESKEIIVRLIFIYLLSLCITIVFSAIQLLPTLEIIQNSPRSSGLDFSTATSFPFPLKHLLSFVNPFLFGNPKYGTYPPFSANWGIFWENTSYIGIAPLLFVIITLFVKKIRKQQIFWFILITISLLLALGKNSPLYLIFTVPPFSIFRVPSRFLLPFTFSLVVIFSYGLDFFVKLFLRKKGKKLGVVISFIIFIVIASDIIGTWKDYHPLGKVSQWLAEPRNSHYLKSLGRENLRIETIPLVYESWNKVFLKTGWQNIMPYKDFREDLNANINALFYIPSLNVYGALLPTRHALIQQFIQDLTLEKDNKLSISTVSAQTNSVFSVTHIISPYEINNPNLKLERTQNNEVGNYYLYKNLNYLPRFRFATGVVNVTTLNQAVSLLGKEDNDFSNVVILENVDKKDGVLPKYSIKVKKDSNLNISLEATTNEAGYLIVADSFYPGWEAYVNGKKVTILLANLNQKAIWLEAGKNEITLNYNPLSLKYGLLITSLSLSLATIYLVVSPALVKKSPSIFHNAFASLHLRSNHEQ